MDFRGQKRSNETHASTTDPDARLYRKSTGTGARLCYMGHVLMENRHGLVVDTETTRAAGFAERLTAVALIDDVARPDGRRITLGADRAYNTQGFIADLRDRCVTPHDAARRLRRQPAHPQEDRGGIRLSQVGRWTGQDPLSRAGARPLRLHAHGRCLQSRPAAQTAGGGMMAVPASLVGQWRSVETGAWPRDHLDLCGPAFLRIDDDGTGEMAFDALTAAVDGGFTASGVDFNWNGADEGDQITGSAWADLRADGRFKGEIAYDNGDDTTFIAKPWPFSAAC